LHIAAVTALADDAGDPIFGFDQLAGGVFKQKFRAMTLGFLLVQPCHLGQAGNAGKFRTAGPEFKAGQVAGKILIAGPMGDDDGVPLFLTQGLNHPVKAFAAGPCELHHQLGIGAVVAPELPVVEELDFIHMGNPPLCQKLGIDMSQIVAHCMEQALLLLIHGNYLCTGFGSGTGSCGAGMGAANHNHVGSPGFLDQRRSDGGRGLPPGCV